jgi:hypothetical protein
MEKWSRYELPGQEKDTTMKSGQLSISQLGLYFNEIITLKIADHG